VVAVELAGLRQQAAAEGEEPSYLVLLWLIEQYLIRLLLVPEAVVVPASVVEAQTETHQVFLVLPRREASVVAPLVVAEAAIQMVVTAFLPVGLQAQHNLIQQVAEEAVPALSVIM
jgi:hypothetical protein